MAIHGRYCTLNSFNSIAYNTIHPAALGLLIAHYRGMFVKTTTV